MRLVEMGKYESQIAEQIIKPDAETAPVNSAVPRTLAADGNGWEAHYLEVVSKAKSPFTDK